MRSPNLIGSAFMVLAMIGFGIEDALFKSATASVSAGVGTLIFGLVGTALFVALSMHARESVWPRALFSTPLLWRSVCETGGRLFFALALAFAPLATTSAILQAAPLVVTAGAALILGEHVGRARWVAMGVGFAGVLLILRPWGADFSPALLFAVGGMLGFAGRDLATRASAPSLSARQLGTSGFAMVILAGAIITLFEPVSQAPDARALIRLLATGCVGVLAYTALTRAMRSGEVSVVAPFRYARLLVALILAFLIFAERPDAIMLIGAVLIVGSGIYTLATSGPARRSRLEPPA
ncbi:EamA-like transporter family protein [Rhodobacteraceae bacterium THAF1]|uniref:DMT family transporter n=1 Tax=Palleronia sp. THAF1 TaxID=2587842 RepID=UPI000F4053BA|nr:DMT family transporter [Palleronia sp. THAF1]QFU09771.1 EamA-like transporter family protein [Palleronia sp. THAF1]VDC17326.1 EamA-like transporter family protein [Rhodobacteraceae bacterium THAF1]